MAHSTNGEREFKFYAERNKQVHKMNKEVETIIVKTFFEKRIQERVLFELSAPKKRKDAIRLFRYYGVIKETGCRREMLCNFLEREY